MFRENKISESNEHFERWLKYCRAMRKTVETEHKLAIAFDKAYRAANDAREAHVMLCGDTANFAFNRDIPYMFEIGNEADYDGVIKIMTKRAEEAYEYFESHMEDAALSKFHSDAFGE
jgi:hypothetical protein